MMFCLLSRDGHMWKVTIEKWNRSRSGKRKGERKTRPAKKHQKILLGKRATPDEGEQ